MVLSYNPPEHLPVQPTLLSRCYNIFYYFVDEKTGLMQIKAVLWDMDGTLVDNGEAHYQAWTETLVEYQIPFSRELFHRIFGIPNQPAS